MAFSLFGKKPAPVAKAPARSAAPAGAKPAAVEEELASLDFTQPGELPKSDRSKIEVSEAPHQIPDAVEQAAMLFSVEQTGEACAVLEGAIRHDHLQRYEQRAWGMLFDLYQLTGRREAFEALALEFAGRFETSPPTWQPPAAETPDAALATGGRAFVALSGVLNTKAVEPLKQLLRLAESNPVVRLEVTKLTDADDAGCGLLLSVLVRLKKARKECVLGGSEGFAAILAKKILPGRRELENTWLLLLELYQQLYKQEAFEEAAVNYAVTFEVSPPSWEPAKTKPAAAAAIAAEEPVAACSLSGELVATDESAFVCIRVQAESSNEIVVDVGRLTRMDFIAAAHLLNVLNELAAQRKKVRLVRASHLVTALWEVIGLDRIATIETRKA